MRKILFSCFLCCAFLSAPQMLDAQSLDEAIITAAVRISRELPENTKAAIISFNSPTEELTKYVINELNGNILRNRRVTPVVPDQNQLHRIQSELRFNAAGEVETESAQSIGRMLGAAYIITGTLERHIGSEYNLLLNVYDAAQAQLQIRYTASLNLRNDQHLSVLLGIVVQQGSQTSFLDEDSWKNKNLYLGGGLGIWSITGVSVWTQSEDSKVPEDISGIMIPLSLISDFVINDFFTIGVSISYNFFSDLNISLMAKLGRKFNLFELTGNLGFTLDLFPDLFSWSPISGLTFGGTFGIKAGNGIIFIDISAIPWGILNEYEYEEYSSGGYYQYEYTRIDSAFKVLIGYKIGVGKDRK